MKMKEVRVTTITGDVAEAIEQLLEREGMIIYRKVDHRILDIYTDKYVEDKK